MENPESSPSPAEEALEREHREARREAAWIELFGVAPPLWEDESKAPPVDEDLLDRFSRGELSSDEEKRVLRLSLRFWSWAKAAARICSKTFRERQQ